MTYSDSEMPDWPDLEARAEWMQIAERLEVDELQLRLFEACAAQYVEWIRSTRSIRDDGLVLTAPDGRLYLSPHAALAIEALQHATDTLEFFGVLREPPPGFVNERGKLHR